ncbi:MAG TPA: hypothetical protein VLY24_03970 [Bryobacteraceae bacterium]|nr:hypothetical protein [Bryobacteraceae bacterium]
MSQKQTNALLEDIADSLGHDVYYIYPDSLHSIPPEIVNGIAVGCVLEFLNGFVDFKSLGVKARQAIGDVLKGWRSSRDLEPLIQTLNLQNVASDALALAPPVVSAPQMDDGQMALKQALLEFGMDESVADEHSKAIRQLVERSLMNTGGPHGRE